MIKQAREDGDFFFFREQEPDKPFIDGALVRPVVDSV